MKDYQKPIFSVESFALCDVVLASIQVDETHDIGTGPFDNV